MAKTAPNPLSAVEPWELVADGYDEITRELLAPFSRRAIELLEPDPADRAADVACGPGTAALLLAPQVARVRGLDFSAAMIEHARRRAAELGLSNVDFVLGDGQALPWPDASHELALSMFGLMFFPDRARGFHELRRILGPGGRAVVSSWAPAERSPAMTLLFEAMRAALPSLPSPQRTVDGLDDRDGFRAALLQAGFARAEVVEHTESLGSGDPERYWHNSVRGAAPIALLRRGMGDEAWAEVERRALDRLRELWVPDAPLTSTALLGVGWV